MGKNCVQPVNWARTSLWSSGQLVGKVSQQPTSQRGQVELYTKLCALYQQLCAQAYRSVLISKIVVIHLFHRDLLLGRTF